MAIPTFNGTPLCSAGQRDLPGSPQARAYVETLPGLDGQFVQTHGVAGRLITVTGSLTATGASAAAAHQALKAALRQKQALVDGQSVAEYLGTDGHSYTDCIMESYEPAGDVLLSAAGGSCKARVAVRARIRQLVPTP